MAQSKESGFYFSWWIAGEYKLVSKPQIHAVP